MSPRRIGLLAALTAVAVLIGMAMIRPADAPRPAAVEAEEARGGAEELEEQRETTEARLEALRDAREAGVFGTREPVTGRPAPGWWGEQLMNPRTDDWEPALAADPNAPYVYLITTRYGEPKPCKGNCPTPFIALEISKDGGKTWSDGRPLCPCKGPGQYDPIIEVVPDTGDVYALYMNGYNVVFLKSTDHGRTWSDPVPTYGKVSWNDKPVLAPSDNGRHIYVSWNGPTNGDAWVAQSHDFGETWTQAKLSNTKDRYFFAFDADVLPDGTVVFSESSLTYTGPGASAEGQVYHHAFISRDRGATWSNVRIDQVELGPPCTTDGCYADFHSGHNTVSADADGDLVYLYDGATTPGGPQRIWARTSTDGGRSWSDRVRLSRPRRNSTGPAAEAVSDGDVRAWYAERSPSGDHWNIWYRSSRDGGTTWSKAVKISDATSGAGYKTDEGFIEFYGDYGEIAVTKRGKTIATWGEGFSWWGPGGSWFNLQR